MNETNPLTPSEKTLLKRIWCVSLECGGGAVLTVPTSTFVETV